MFRQMRRHAQQLTPRECEAILAQSPRGVLAVLGEKGYPYTIPLNFVYDDGKIYFHSAIEGHKLDAIKTSDKCSFCVMDEGAREEGSWWYHFNSVVAFGRICRLQGEDTIVYALRKLGSKYFPKDYDIEGDIARNIKRVAVLELTIEHLTGKHVREK